MEADTSLSNTLRTSRDKFKKNIVVWKAPKVSSIISKVTTFKFKKNIVVWKTVL